MRCLTYGWGPLVGAGGGLMDRPFFAASSHNGFSCCFVRVRGTNVSESATLHACNSAVFRGQLVINSATYLKQAYKMKG